MTWECEIVYGDALGTPLDGWAMGGSRELGPTLSGDDRTRVCWADPDGEVPFKVWLDDVGVGDREEVEIGLS